MQHCLQRGILQKAHQHAFPLLTITWTEVSKVSVHTVISALKQAHSAAHFIANGVNRRLSVAQPSRPRKEKLHSVLMSPGSHPFLAYNLNNYNLKNNTTVLIRQCQGQRRSSCTFRTCCVMKCSWNGNKVTGSLTQSSSACFAARR